MHRYHTYGNLALVLPKHTTDQDKVRQYHAITPTRLKRALDEASESNRAKTCQPPSMAGRKDTRNVRPRTTHEQNIRHTCGLAHETATEWKLLAPHEGAPMILP